MSEKRKLDENEALEEEPVMFLRDIIEEDAELEMTANAVLGGSDDKACTYPQGYVLRQALYACATCTPSPNTAGVCLACSLECHDGHELYELYTKRNFKCDCGNDKFPDLVCKLYPDKTKSNEKNSYNHNFEGLYCTCKRPYPDLDNDVEDEMIQCVCCEDWFHGRHLGGKMGSNFSEMICDECMKGKTSFLWPYYFEYSENRSETSDVDVVITEPKEEHETSSKSDKNLHNPQGKCDSENNDSIACILKKLQGEYKETKHPKGASFWPEDWRTKLCRCDYCQQKYKDVQLEFLLDAEDTITAYESKGGNKYTKSTIDSGMQALGSMNHVQQIEVIRGYNDMKTKLSQFLKTFADEGKVVTESDIKTFFQQMSQQKRQKVVVPHLCK